MLEYIENLITSVDPVIAYLILFSSAYIENTFPPIPGDTVTVIGAYLISTGKLSFFGVFLSTTAGSILGFFTMYLVGHRLGMNFLKNPRRQKIFNARRIDKVQKWFDRYGYGVIAANRFLSGTRSVISLFAGTFKLKGWKVLILATISACIWNGVLMYGGYLLGINWPRVNEILANYQHIVIGLTVIALISFLTYRIKKKKKKEQNHVTS